MEKQIFKQANKQIHELRVRVETVITRRLFCVGKDDQFPRTYDYWHVQSEKIYPRKVSTREHKNKQTRTFK